MSLSGALSAGISALQSSSKAISIVADNISNMGTLGYKKRESIFSSMVVNSQNKGGPILVESEPRAYVSKKGGFFKSHTESHMALSQDGFFIVRQAKEGRVVPSFTRIGTFEVDSSGYLKNHLGYYLQAQKLVDGKEVKFLGSDTSGLSAINLKSLTMPSSKTSIIDLGIRFDASKKKQSYKTDQMKDDKVKPHFSTSMQIFDAKGKSYKINFDFVKTADKTWSYEVYGDSSEISDSGKITSGTLTFDEDGSLKSVTGGIKTLKIDFTSGATSQNVQINLEPIGTKTRIDSSRGTEVEVAKQNGHSSATMSGWDVRSNGIIDAIFSDGRRKAIYQIPIANVIEPNQMKLSDSGSYQATSESGIQKLSNAGIGDGSRILKGTLEGSNVEIADEFSDMIKIKRKSSAAGKIVMVTDKMLEELMRMVRA